MSIYYPNIINPNDPVNGSNVPFSNPMTGALDMGGFQVINSSDAVLPNSLTTLSQVSGLIASSGGSGGGGGGGGGWVGTATSELNMNSLPIQNASYIGIKNGFDNNQLTIVNSSTSTHRSFGYSDLGGGHYTQFYDTVYNPPSGNLDGLTIVNGDLEYNDAIVLTADPSTTSIGTLSCTTSYSANTLLPPYSNFPPINATTCTLSANMTYNSGNHSFISSNGQSTAFSNFAVGNGSTISWTQLTNTVVSSVEAVVGFYTPNATAGQPPVLVFSAMIIPNGDELSVAISYTNLQGDIATLQTDDYVTLDTSISLVYADNIFQVLVDGVILPLCTSNNPVFANMPLSQTSNLSLLGMFGCNQGLSMSQPSMGLYGGYLPAPLSSRGFTMFSGTSSIVPVKTYSYLINLAIPINISSSVIPLNGNDPSTTSRLDIFILDSNNHSVINSNPCWTFIFQNANQYMTWDAVAGLLRFNYQSNSASPVVGNSSIVENFYNMPWTTVSLVAPFTYYYQFSLTQPYLMGSTGLSFSTTITDTNTNVFRYPLCSQSDGVNTQIKIGNHQEPLLSLKLSDSTLKCGNDTIITTANISNYGIVQGLNINPENSLLQFNDQAVMINQYIATQIPDTMTSTITPNTQLLNTNVGTVTIIGDAGDLFSNNDGFNLSIVMTSTDLAIHWPPWVAPSQTSQIMLYVNITDGAGVNILPNTYSTQPCFFIQDTTGYSGKFIYKAINATTGTISLNMIINDTSVPNGIDKYNLFTQGIRPNLVGPFTVTYTLTSYYSLVNVVPTTGYSTINSVTSSFGFVGPDMSNPYPVLSNYNGSNKITTIRTGQNGPLIQTYQAAGLAGGWMNISTDSLQLIPTNSTTSKSWSGVITGNLKCNLVSIFSINIQPIPTTAFSFSYKWFIWFSPTIYCTTQVTGLGNPATLQVLGLSANMINISSPYYPYNSNYFTTKLSQGGLLITASSNIQESPNGSPIYYYYTLTYDFICI